MTIVEWILVIEVVIFAVLGIMLVLMLFNRSRTGQRGQGVEKTLYRGSCPAQDSCDLYRKSYAQNPYYARPHVQDPRFYQNNWNYNGNTGPAAGSGIYPGAGYQTPAGNASPYFAQGHRNPAIPSPVIGQERGQSLQRRGLTPADISAMEGKTLLHIDSEQTGNYGNRTIPYEVQETLLRKVESGSSKNVDRTSRPSTVAGAVRQGTHKNTRWKIDFIEMSSGRQVTRDFQNTLVVGRQMPAPLESGRLYLSMDATVSRSQFCLFIENGRVMIENLSRVNVTKKNGNPVWQPVSLEEGDILEMGRMRYLVKGISSAA